MEILIKKFQQLSLKELYAVLHLRSQIFVVEQDCVYLDIDQKDEKAWHILGLIDGQIMAYARCFPSKIYFEEAAIGRVLVAEKHRKKGHADHLIATAVQFLNVECKEPEIKLSAQQHLVKFYEKHGFSTYGEGYLEDGIPHIAMRRKENP